MSATRREARERALELLYEADMKSAPLDDVLAQLPVVDPFTRELAVGVVAERSALETDIAARLRSDWPFERLATIDRLVLLLGLWELRHATAPDAVVLSEAVELAKKYGGGESARFVNGVLAALSS